MATTVSNTNTRVSSIGTEDLPLQSRNSRHMNHREKSEFESEIPNKIVGSSRVESSRIGAQHIKTVETRCSATGE